MKTLLAGFKKHGLPPGTVVHIGKPTKDPVSISYFKYDEHHLEEQIVSDVREVFGKIDKKQVMWININGIHHTEVVEAVGEYFGLHPLVLEDIVHTGQRPKFEEGEDSLFFVLKMLSFDAAKLDVQHEQVSLILKDNVVISFQEREGDVFDPIRDRIRTAKGRIRKRGGDYLVYSLLDAIVDYYFVVLEKIGEQIDRLETEIEFDLTQTTQNQIYRLKREMIFLRQSVWPIREMISGMERTESKMIKKETALFIRDLYDHTIQVMEAIDTFRDILAGMLDTCLSILSNRMNEVMKVLTIIATLFIPLTFIAGVYGMNFHWMPELGWKWGYPMVWLIMIAATVLMMFYFKKKKWL